MLNKLINSKSLDGALYIDLIYTYIRLTKLKQKSYEELKQIR